MKERRDRHFKLLLVMEDNWELQRHYQPGALRLIMAVLSKVQLSNSTPELQYFDKCARFIETCKSVNQQ